MKTFVRILGIILLLLSASLMITSFFISIPVKFSYLLLVFIIGSVSFMWSNLRDNKKD